MQRVYREGVSTPAREVKVIRPDGEVRPLETVAAPMRYEGKPAALLVLSDTTERNALQEQLLQAQKMEVVGQLAGGMAHDFNNLLTPILGFAGLVKERLAQDDPGREFMEEIEHAAGRAGLARPPAPRLLPSAAHGAEGSRSE